LGHEDAFPRPRLSARCRFGQGTFAGTRGNERDAALRCWFPGPTIRTRGGAALSAKTGLGSSPMGTRKRFLGWYLPGIRHPPSFPTHPSTRSTVINHARDRDRRASTAATGRRIVPSNLGPLLEGHGGVLAGRWASGDRPDTPRLTALGRSCQGFRRTGNLEGLKSAVVAKSLVTPRMQDGGSRHVEPLRRWLR
jgi:hypothetical protein